MTIKIVRNDITKMQVDAIVNAVSEHACYGDGIDKSVYKAAGEKQLLAAREKIGRINGGEAAITPGFQLPSKYIIHVVIPLYIDGQSGEEAKLRSCYRESFRLAKENECSSIAFPLISTGGYNYHKEDGIRIAIDELQAFLSHEEMLVYLVVFDEESSKLSANLYPDLESYIDNNYVGDIDDDEYGCMMASEISFSKARPQFIEENSSENALPEDSIWTSIPDLLRSHYSKDEDIDIAASECIPPDEDYDSFIEEKESDLNIRMEHLAGSFQQYLFYLIETKELTNTEVYKRAIITKQTFSKIKLNPDYHPDKATAMRLCIGAMLNLDETKDLLARAGYALSPCGI